MFAAGSPSVADDQLFCPTVAEDVAFGPMNWATREEVRRSSANARRLEPDGYEDATHKLGAVGGPGHGAGHEPDVLLMNRSPLDEVATERVLDILAELPQAMLIVCTTARRSKCSPPARSC